MHSDFWIYPSYVVDTAALNKIWHLGPGLTRADDCSGVIDTMCLAEFHSDPTWFWWENSMEAAFRAWQDMEKLLPFGSIGNISALHAAKVCAGWADLFYLPVSTLNPFSDLSYVFKDVFHEVAVPTILEILVLAERVKRRKLWCWGGCCGTAGIAEMH
eukprot:7933521-Pyramimonas_sp.AAC.1